MAVFSEPFKARAADILLFNFVCGKVYNQRSFEVYVFWHIYAAAIFDALAVNHTF